MPSDVRTVDAHNDFTEDNVQQQEAVENLAKHLV